MTINPIAFADEVNKQFLRYQLTAFPLSDPDMAKQAKEMLEGSDPDSHLVKGPYISLSRSFYEEESIEIFQKKYVLYNDLVMRKNEQRGIGEINKIER